MRPFVITAYNQKTVTEDLALSRGNFSYLIFGLA